MKCVSPFGLFVAQLTFLIGWFPSFAQADILQWEYVDPADPSLGKQQSTTLAPDGAGLAPGPGMNALDKDLTMAYLAGFDLTGADIYRATLTKADLTGSNLTDAILQWTNLTGADLSGTSLRHALFDNATMTDADLSEANLSGARLGQATLTGADLTGATIRGANLGQATQNGFTAEQLYSTGSYQAGDLTGIFLYQNDLSGWNFSGQDLTNASFGIPLFFSATLTGADLSGATIRGARFFGSTSFGFTAEQLYSTASYQVGDLVEVELPYCNLTGWDFSGQDLTGAILGGATLTGANLSGADARATRNLDSTGAITENLIHPDGHIAGLELAAGQALRVRDFSGETPIPIRVDEQMIVDAAAMLQMEFEDDQWGSTISFAPGVPISLGGTLTLQIDEDVSWPTLVGTSFPLFDWTGVTPTGTFDSIVFQEGTEWDSSDLYTTGEVILVRSIPEPSSPLLSMFGAGLLGVMWRRR